jgi:cell wall assembly regulator SMI1
MDQYIVDDIWKKIESWDSTHRDAALGSYLNDPAPDEMVNDLNRKLAGKLPLEFLESLRRHDGTAGWTTEFCDGRLLSAKLILHTLNEIVDIAEDLADADQRNALNRTQTLTPLGPVKNVFWSKHWIPFHVTDCSKTCFDFDPAKGGEIGQIIEVNWEGETVKVISKNYVEFLRMCAEQLPDEPD